MATAVTKLSYLLPLWLLSICASPCTAQLSFDYYSKSCPNVETLVRRIVKYKFSKTFVTAPGTLRLLFHDCIVEGCDASVMIASTANNTAEKDYTDNLSLAGDGFDTINKAKLLVEKACPNTVSCADILALATRDVIRLVGGPRYKVELGRRDGKVSMASRVKANLPTPDMTVGKLMRMFMLKRLNLTDLVALSGGGHTIGFSHCDKFSSRVYGNQPASTLNASYAEQLRQMCPKNVDPTIAINMDPTTPRRFDNAYFKNLKQGMGLFTSDQTLYSDRRTRPFVERFASDSSAFLSAFVEAITKLGRVGVKTGREGEIRRVCSLVN